jgi:hypothetical protein
MLDMIGDFTWVKKIKGFERKKKGRIFKLKKKVKISHLWKVWADLKSDNFTSVEVSHQM